MISATISIRDLERSLNRLAQSIEPAREAALDAMATRTVQGKAKEVSKTYKRPIPRGKNGKPKWTRSGDWQEGQAVDSRPGERVIRTQGNAEKYEPRLANLPTGADGVNRTNKAAENAFKTVKPQLEAIGQREFENHLRLNG